jgi:hypothetical protein
MPNADEDWRPDFEQAMGEAFGEFVCPPVPFEDASPHECCEVVWEVAGHNATPTGLAALTDVQVVELSRRFGAYFDCEPPTFEQIKGAIAHTLARWPVGSLGEV